MRADYTVAQGLPLLTAYFFNFLEEPRFCVSSLSVGFFVKSFCGERVGV